MSTRLDTDPELFDLVRAADPMRDPRVQANAGLDTESALCLIAPKLDLPPAPRRARRRRRTALRVAVLTGAVLAAVFVAVNVTSTGNGSDVVSRAQAQTILRHVRAALVWPAHAIYEEDAVGSVTARNGAKFTTRDQKWVSTSPPYNQRLVRSWNGKVQWEQEFVNGRLDLYDPRTNTVYLAPGVASNQVSDQPQWNSVLAMVSDLLAGQVQDPAAPKMTVNPHAVLDGKKAIEITFDDGRFSYWISPSTYKPLQSVDRWDSLPDGQGGVGIERYPIVRVLTGSAASPKLLSLRAQHPGATLDRSSTDYAAAMWRMNHVDRLLRHCTRSGCS
jgi:hypothetical protein